VEYCSVAWGDYDNDGDLDLLLTGCATAFLSCTSISQIYRNDSGNFTNINAGLTGLSHSSVAWGDYDNDGDLDLVLTGCINSSCSAGSTLIYTNDGGTFIEVGTGFDEHYRSSVAWGDYDNDGDLDLLLSGCIDTGLLTCIGSALIYRNDNGTFVQHNAGLTPLSQSSGAWGDYDNDGDLDLLLTGCANGTLSLCTSHTALYRNDNGIFTALPTGITAVRDGSVAWGDYDADGDLDFLLTGNNGGGRVAILYTNDNPFANTRPSAPTDLSAAIDRFQVLLQWNTATDPQTPTAGLTYNLRVGTTPGGSDVVAPMAFPTGSNAPLRLLPALGNSQHGTTAPLKLSNLGIYYWSVQAIDSAFAGGEWAAESTFSILPQLTIHKSVDNANPLEGSTITYTVAVTNTGAFTTTGVVISDTLAGNLATNLTLAIGDTFTHSYAQSVGDGPSSIVNVATVASDQTLPTADSVAVTVQNRPPTVSAGPEQSVAIGTPVTLTTTIRDYIGDTVNGLIEWGDSQSTLIANGVSTTTHLYDAAGTYTVTVSATDDDGASTSLALLITVNAPTPTPTPTATASNTPIPPTTTATATDTHKPKTPTSTATATD